MTYPKIRVRFACGHEMQGTNPRQPMGYQWSEEKDGYRDVENPRDCPACVDSRVGAYRVPGGDVVAEDPHDHEAD